MIGVKANHWELVSYSTIAKQKNPLISEDLIKNRRPGLIPPESLSYHPETVAQAEVFH